MTICKQLQLSDIELGQIIEAVTVRCTETHRAAPSYSNELFELLVKLKSSTPRPAPVVPSDDGDGAPFGCTDDVDGGIFSIVKRLKEIKEEINQLNGSAFEKLLLSDAQHYQLLDVEMFLSDFVSRAAGEVEQ